ncbi:hypothetical protein ICW40_12465 [Actinotalea ferrariae]|uniref:hypothetical protein n=1 Tax=Actinotalea ferrariae TaxID=1386098 RepID=UPI001C8CD4FB|nr:hypothetical protein [Actinotalea ferrariae]MBX9245615.1 hypothetical protein [Actinotalea ferrariae]
MPASRARALRALAAAGALALVALTGLVGPAGAATETTRTRIRGPLIQAQADVLDGCIERHVFVQAMADTTGEPIVLVLDSRVDVCGGDTGSFGEGQATPDLLDVRPNLSSGRLVATVPITTFDGEPAGTIELDLTFTGTGPITATRFRQKVTDPGGTTITTTIRDSSRAAVVTGEPAIDFQFAMIGNVRQGQVVRTHT